MDDSAPESDVQPLPYAAARKYAWTSLSRPSRSRFERAFLVTLFVIVGALFFTLVLPEMARDDQPRIKPRIAKQMVSSGGMLAAQIALYRQNTGQYPTALKDLTTRPADPAVAMRWGDEPYLDPNSLYDPWGTLVEYRLPGVHNPSSFDLWSMGPDGVSGTADDIGNWE